MKLGESHQGLVAFSFIVFFFLSLLVSVMPALQMQKIPPTPGLEPLKEGSMEALGRKIYLKEGCATCHTQFLRNLAVDSDYGRGALAGDYAYEDPPLLGTQRTGPDLSNVGLRQPSEVWNLIHLYNPRAVVKTSVMPGYPWYFYEINEGSQREDLIPVPEDFVPEGKKIAPTKEAVALVRYLQSLSQPSLEQ